MRTSIVCKDHSNGRGIVQTGSKSKPKWRHKLLKTNARETRMLAYKQGITSECCQVSVRIEKGGTS